MVQEIVYKLFVYVWRLLPELKLIVAGDVAQLLPAKDRLKNCTYQNSVALHEICDAQRLCLTRCRRPSGALFAMLAPENVANIPKPAFSPACA